MIEELIKKLTIEDMHRIDNQTLGKKCDIIVEVLLDLIIENKKIHKRLEELEKAKSSDSHEINKLYDLHNKFSKLVDSL